MESFFIFLDQIPSGGKDFVFKEKSIWEEPIKKYNLETKIKEIEAFVFIQPIKNGCFIKGRLKGILEVPCYRCNELTDHKLDFIFRLVESIDKPHELGVVYLIEENNRLKLDIAGILWEQFVISQPFKYLCSEDCKGLCPVCGKNLNFGECDCQKESLDPRMEIFRKLKLNFK